MTKGSTAKREAVLSNIFLFLFSLLIPFIYGATPKISTTKYKTTIRPLQSSATTFLRSRALRDAR
jgi:hypothetical protein